ncbi:hypothetical protein JCM16303_004031 [Sporobolomyces ruberrimus]
MSLFRRKKSTSKHRTNDAPPGSSFAPRSSSSNSPQTTPQTLHVDDFGRPIDRPAFSTQTDRGSPRFGNGYGVGDDHETSQTPPQEMQLLYGYAPLGTQLEFGIARVEDIVTKCAVQIRQRGLDTPLIMSSRALDISLEGVSSLIRAYLEDSQSWESDLEFAAPLAVGAFMKWGLARLVNNQGGRGFVTHDAYREFRTAEKARGFQPKSCTMHLIARMSTSNGRLLSSLLSLFSSIAAHSAKNGMPPRRLASLFSPYIFGLADDQTFDVTYREWQKATDATEHIILAYIRDQQTDGPLPTFLEKFIVNYPSDLNISYDGRSPTIPQGAKVEEVTRVRRLTRFHSRNLIASAGTWDVPHSVSWQLFFNQNPSLASSTSSTTSPNPVYSNAYRHLLNIRTNTGLDDEFEDEFDQGRYKTRVDKEWSKFGELGFSDVDEKKLEFDLTEGERAVPELPQKSMDWNTFETSGFAGRELFAPNDLVFQQSLKQRVNTWPSAAKFLNDRLRATEKLLPAFPFDTTAHEEPTITIDGFFFEAWADVLVGGGWARDELKESSFALIQWKCRPRVGDVGKARSPGSANSDPRTEDRWVLVEEFVPREYREALTDPRTKKQQPKRISFLRTVRRKNTTSAKPSPSAADLLSPSPNFSLGAGISSASLGSSSPRSLRPIDESVFTNENAQTTKVSLSNRLERTSYAPTSYAPSVVSTAAANDGHAALSNLSLAPEQNGHFQYRSNSPPPPVPTNEVYGINVNGPPKTPKRGFMARINTMRNREKSRNGTTGVGAEGPRTREPSAPMPAASAFEPSPSDDVFVEPIPSRNPVWADAIPNAPPVLGAVSPPPPPPKSDDVYQPAPVQRPNYDTRISTLTTSTNPYGGMEDEDVPRRPDTEEEGEVLFRGSRSYENGLSEVAGTGQSPRRNGGSTAPRPLRKDVSTGSSGSDPNVPRESDDSPARPPYLSGVSEYSSRVANIVGLYEQRDQSPTKTTNGQA